jgi:hypothetical protein
MNLLPLEVGDWPSSKPQELLKLSYCFIYGNNKIHQLNLRLPTRNVIWIIANLTEKEINIVQIHSALAGIMLL